MPPTDHPHIPDLDPRADAHIVGSLTLMGFIVLALGIVLIALIVLVIGHFILGGYLSAALTLLIAGGWTFWVIVDGPHHLWLRHRWGQRHHPASTLPDVPLNFPAAHAQDPFWTGHGMTWAMARLTLPPVILLEESQVIAWHARLAQALRMAATHGVWIDVRAAQLPGSEVVPPPTMTPLMAERWRWWAQQVGPASVQSMVMIRMAWPQTQRDAAAIHFLAVEQAWRAAPGPGEWQWLSAMSARELSRAAANPAEAYAHWQSLIQNRLLSGAPRRRARPRS